MFWSCEAISDVISFSLSDVRRRARLAESFVWGSHPISNLWSLLGVLELREPSEVISISFSDIRRRARLAEAFVWGSHLISHLWSQLDVLELRDHLGRDILQPL
jgi:propanediol dehydratase large subunit